MKHIILASIFALSGVAFAEANTTQNPANTDAPAATAPMAKKEGKKVAKANKAKHKKGTKAAKDAKEGSAN